jgi:hypothetical protein
MTARARSGLLLILDEENAKLHRPALSAALETMVETHLAGTDGLLLPAVLKVPEHGPAWLYAYTFDNRAVRVQISARIMYELQRGAPSERLVWELRSRVADLAANFRSRVGAAKSFWRAATAPDLVVARQGRDTRELSES